MENKKNSSGIWSKVGILLGIVFAIFLGGYFLLDKLIVPHYFKDYGINGMGDLFGVISSLYQTPNESQLIANGYSDDDLQSALNDLTNAGYDFEIDSEGKIVLGNNFKDSAVAVELTDREFAAVANSILKSNILDDNLQELNYFELGKLSILEVTFNFDEDSKSGDVYSRANISFIAKLDTAEMINQIEEQMETPKMLLNMIIPTTLYFSVSYDLDLERMENERISNGKIAINGRTEKQSEILINMLVDFIFPPEDGMNMHNFILEFGNIILKGIDELGEFKFKQVNERNGLFISAN